MEELEILNTWKAHNALLHDHLVLNRKNTEDITRMKVQWFLASMKPIKIFTLIAGIIWVGILDVLIINLFPIANPFFLGSAITLTLLNKLAIGIYLYQLILIHQADISEPVLATQEKIARLKSSTLWVARILFLQLPLWTIFYWNKSMWENGNAWLWSIQLVVTVSSVYAAIWLFMNIRFSNRNKKWFRLIFKGKEWTPVMKSMELLEQVNAYQADNKPAAGNTGA